MFKIVLSYQELKLKFLMLDGTILAVSPMNTVTRAKVNLENALEFINETLITTIGRETRKPEITVLMGTWKGMTYEQMAKSSTYSANYLMRDVAPKFWKLLSTVLEEDVGKNNLRQTLEQIYRSSPGFVESKLTGISKNPIHNSRQDWKDAISSPAFFYGRQAELQTIVESIRYNHCQIFKIWGLSGIVQEQYEIIIWRSLATAPRLQDLMADILWTEFNIVEKEEAKLLPQLVACIKSCPCLIMLDGMEAIFKSKTFSGNYREQHNNYADFLHTIGESSHSSCILITCLENSDEIITTQNQSFGCCLKLSGLSNSEALELQKHQNLDLASQLELERLSNYYQGSPGLLLSAAQIIRKLFNGNVQEFLEQKSLVFGAIEKTLNKSSSRLSNLEIEILFWLTSESQAVSLVQIQQSIPLSIYGVELIQALESLIQRSLVEVHQIDQYSVYTLVPMINELVTNQFIAQISEKFSLANRLNSDHSFELGNITPKPTHLSKWLDNNFESGWQSMAKLFTKSRKVSARLRSVFSLRSPEVVKRFKQVKLQGNKPISVLLLIAVIQEEYVVKICVQAQPTFLEQVLPANLQLHLLDSTSTNLASTHAKSKDSYIQLPCFRGEREEKFKVSLRLESADYEEVFLI